MSKSSFSLCLLFLLIFIITVPSFGQTREGKLGVGVDGSTQYLLGAGATNSSLAFGGGLNLSYSVMEYFGIRAKCSYSPIAWKGGLQNSLTTDMMSLLLYVGSDLMPNSNINIFPFIGGGVTVFDPRDDLGVRAVSNGKPVSNFDLNISFGASVDYFLNEFWSLTLMGEYVLTNSAYYAGSQGGNVNIDKNDSFTRVSLQVRYYFFDQTFITKLLEAQRDRLKRGK